MACKPETNVVLLNGFSEGDHDENERPQSPKPDDLEKHVRIVERTWALVKQDKRKHGAEFYMRLLSKFPEVKQLFSFGKDEKLDKGNTGLQHQADLLMTMIDYAVRCLGDLGELVPKLKRLGKRHFVKYNVREEHFQPVGESLLWTLKESLGDLFTQEVEAAWTAIYTILADVMIEGGSEVEENDVEDKNK